MPSRTALLAAVTAVALLVVGAGVVLAADGTAAAESDRPTIAVTGAAAIDAEPDTAVVQVSVTARGADAGTVSEEVAGSAADLRAALGAFGLDEDQIQTQRYTIRESRDAGERPSDTRYVGEQTFEVTLDDVERVGPLVDAAVDGGADRVGGIHYTVSADRREALRDRALGEAVADARGEATVVAEATGLQLAGVQHASSRETSVRPYRADVSGASLEGAGTDIDPQDVTVSATVEVTFAATAD